MKKIDLNFNSKYSKIFFITAIIILVIAVIIMIISSNKIKEKENTLFSISKIILYNSAGVIDNTNNQSLINLNIDQFSDISIYIDNSSSDELNKLNTIKSLYIDNIKISPTNDNEKILNYKNPLLLGKYAKLDNPDKDKINFEVAKTNYEHNVSNYTNPTFYTDCSNPITLGYLNRNILRNYSISDNKNTVAYNAKVLKDSNVNLEDIKSSLDFVIHIKNNLGHKFSCNMHIDINFDEEFINNGYSYLSIPFSNGEYKFERD